MSRWSDLPKELLEMIGEHLDDPIDILRFRAICTSWRSVVLPYYPPPLILPFPDRPECSNDALWSGFSTVTNFATVYRVQPEEEVPNSLPSGILVLVDKEIPSPYRNSYDMRPLIHLDPSVQNFPKVLNLMDFKFFEVLRVYDMKNYCVNDNYVAYISPNVSKVAVLPSNPGGFCGDSYSAMAIYTPERFSDVGFLYFLKSRDKEWTKIQGGDCFKDVITFGGKFYAVESCGRAIAIDSDMNITEIANPVSFDRLCKTSLLESVGDLLLFKFGRFFKFKLFKLNFEERKWVEVKRLGFRAVFVDKKFSFSVFARDFAGCSSDVIYYNHHIGDLWMVLNLRDGSWRLLHPHPESSQQAMREKMKAPKVSRDVGNLLPQHL